MVLTLTSTSLVISHPSKETLLSWTIIDNTIFYICLLIADDVVGRKVSYLMKVIVPMGLEHFFFESKMESAFGTSLIFGG